MDETQEHSPEEGATGLRAKALGDYGERLAARTLQGLGLQVVERNFTTSAGELDLLLREGDTLVVCEVKTRSSDIGGSPLEAVDEEKVARLRRMAAVWLEAHPDVHPEGVRIDLVGIRLPKRGAAVVEHLRGVG